jgi:hypothetical protein
VLANPNASEEEKLLAGLNIALAGLEFAEPDEWLPASLPLDDVTRKGIIAGVREAVQEGGLRAGVRFIKDALGEAAPGVIRQLYDQGLFRGVKSAGEWDKILRGVRKGADLEVHHLIEKRFVRQLGLDPKDVPAVVLEKAFHQQEVTARLFSELPTRGSFTAQEIWDAYVQVYGRELGHQNWLEAIWPYFERLGVQR